ncbi:MAG TPA: NAD(P)-dependent oxidoreductase [Dehalococcoidia bacterium]|nr:NAD(P)-dependent oxidoreductase [Dehalococcoidia bacterium]
MITGGTGFLGSYLARHLIENKGLTDIVVFDQHPHFGRIAEIRDRVTVVAGDVLQSSELLAAMQKHQVDRVIHLAFILGEPDPNRVVSYLDVQCRGTANVFEAARIQGVRRLAYASSVAVFGHNPPTRDEPVDEDHPPVPNTMYGACKLWSEHIAGVYHRRYGLDVVGLRPCSVFGLGRGQRGSYASGLTPIPDQAHFMVLPEQAALGQAVEMPPDEEVSDWIYAADAAEAWYLAATVENPAHRVFNLRSEQRPIGDLTAHLRRLLPDAKITVGTKRGSNLQLMKNDRLRQDLGFQAKFTLESGLEDYLNLVRRQADPVPVPARRAE